MKSYCSLRRIKSKNVCIVERQGDITAVRIVSKLTAKGLFDFRKHFDKINQTASNSCRVLSVFPCDVVINCVRL